MCFKLWFNTYPMRFKVKHLQWNIAITKAHAQTLAFTYTCASDLKNQVYSIILWCKITKYNSDSISIILELFKKFLMQYTTTHTHARALKSLTRFESGNSYSVSTSIYILRFDDLYFLLIWDCLRHFSWMTVTHTLHI